MLFGAIETCGTTTRVGVAAGDGRWVARTTIATTTPVETVARATTFLAPHRVARVGIAAFGPLDVDPNSASCGTLLVTPKEGWSQFALASEVARALAVPIAIDSDVNAAALAEQEAAERAGIAAETLVYVTVGTGIGVGIALAGRAHHGALHPEAGHLRVRRVEGDSMLGLCPFHGDCLEGLASGPALRLRAGVDPATLAADAPCFGVEADYLAQLVVAIVGFLAPHQLVLGGGVMQTCGLLVRVRARAVELLNGYSPLLASGEAAAARIVAPRLGGDSGLRGALLLAGRS